MWTKFSSKRFSNINFKKREKKKGIKREEPNLLLIITLLLMSPTTQPAFYLVPRREISDMILIIRKNISSNGYNTYY